MNGEDPSSPGGNSRRPMTKSVTDMRGMVAYGRGGERGEGVGEGMRGWVRGYR